LSLEYAASTLKSTSLAIALMNDRVGIEEALDLSRLEENFQQTLYGIVRIKGETKNPSLTFRLKEIMI